MENFVGGIVILLLGGMLVTSLTADSVHRTKKIIEPSLTIVEENGVRDTTYTYTFKFWD